jgi:hypothetical protein
LFNVFHAYNFKLLVIILLIVLYKEKLLQLFVFMATNGRVYETKRIVKLRLYPTCQTPMQDETLQTHCYRFVLYALCAPCMSRAHPSEALEKV